MAAEPPITVNPFLVPEPVPEREGPTDHESVWSLFDSAPLFSFDLQRVDEFAVGEARRLWIERERIGFRSEVTSLELHVVALIIYVLMCILLIPPLATYGGSRFHSRNLIEEVEQVSAPSDLLDAPGLSGH